MTPPPAEQVKAIAGAVDAAQNMTEWEADQVLAKALQDHQSLAHGELSCSTSCVATVKEILAAAGWQVTRDGEGLRAALERLVTLDDKQSTNVRAWSAAYRRARAALASGEEGQ